MWVDFEVSKAHARSSVSHFLSLLPVDQDVKLSSTASAPCLLSTMLIMD